jgi:metal-responsive CopG/Arc/MetJ family transcriptional regulator
MTGYTRGMSKSSHFVKTTISVPNEVYVRATRRAKELGTSRSALFARAVEKELDEEESSVDVIDRINAVVDAVKDDTREFTSTAARRVLAKDDNAKW